MTIRQQTMEQRRRVDVVLHLDGTTTLLWTWQEHGMAYVEFWRAGSLRSAVMVAAADAANL